MTPNYAFLRELEEFGDEIEDEDEAFEDTFLNGFWELEAGDAHEGFADYELEELLGDGSIPRNRIAVTLAECSAIGLAYWTEQPVIRLRQMQHRPHDGMVCVGEWEYRPVDLWPEKFAEPVNWRWEGF